jgi:hypothetical protein
MLVGFIYTPEIIEITVDRRIDRIFCRQRNRRFGDQDKMCASRLGVALLEPARHVSVDRVQWLEFLE